MRRLAVWPGVSGVASAQRAQAVYKRYAGDGLVVIGVHTREYAEERAAVAMKQLCQPLHMSRDIQKITGRWVRRRP